MTSLSDADVTEVVTERAEGVSSGMQFGQNDKGVRKGLRRVIPKPLVFVKCRLAAVGLVAVVVRLVGALDRDAEVVGLLGGELRQLHAELLQVQPGNFFVELLGQHVHADRVTRSFCVQSANWAITWFVNEVDMTNDGCPVAQPRLTSRPSARRMIEWPSGKV